MTYNVRQAAIRFNWAQVGQFYDHHMHYSWYHLFEAAFKGEI